MLLPTGHLLHAAGFQDPDVVLHAIARLLRQAPEVLPHVLALRHPPLDRLHLCLELVALPAEAQLLPEGHRQPRRQGVRARSEDEGLHQGLHHRQAPIPVVELAREFHDASRDMVLANDLLSYPLQEGGNVQEEEEWREQANETCGEHTGPGAAEVSARDLVRGQVESDGSWDEGPNYDDEEVPDHRDDPDSVGEAQHVLVRRLAQCVLKDERLLHQHGPANEDVAEVRDVRRPVLAADGVQAVHYRRRFRLQRLLALSNSPVLGDVTHDLHRRDRASHVDPDPQAGDVARDADIPQGGPRGEEENGQEKADHLH
mmetsp:Transcript_22306/g.63827  ORF Transcript_22306/g.63827 Transcript_22306/m.63827 type:complete len:315 (+) Transcript_22306:348-1292(+)